MRHFHVSIHVSPVVYELLPEIIDSSDLKMSEYPKLIESEL